MSAQLCFAAAEDTKLERGSVVRFSYIYQSAGGIKKKTAEDIASVIWIGMVYRIVHECVSAGSAIISGRRSSPPVVEACY